MFPRAALRSAANASILLRRPRPYLRTQPILRSIPRFPVRTVSSDRQRPKSPRIGTTNQHQSSGDQSDFFSQLTTYLIYLWHTSPAFRIAVGGTGLAGAGFYVSNLEKVPVSGRRRFNWISPEWEKSLAQQGVAPLLEEYRGKILPEWAPETRLVMKVMERLIPNSGIQDGEPWEIRVINENQPNAFVMPGNKVFVFTGILPICQTEDGLATVLGHEIAHNVAHHSAERLSKYILLLPIAIAISTVANIGYDIGGLMVDIGLNRPGSRTQETEADYLGLLIMAKSCYDPDEAVKLWERMRVYTQKQGRNIPQFLSTHPSDRNRVTEMATWLPEAKHVREQGACGFESGFMDPFLEATRGFQ